LDILENALRLITCFAARTAQRPDPTNNNFVIPKTNLWKFATAEAFTSRQPPFSDLKSLLSSQAVIPSNWAGYYFHYYKRAVSSNLNPASVPPRSTSNTQLSPITPTPKSRDSGEPSQKTSESNTGSDGKPTEGWIRLYINPDKVWKQGIEPTFRELATQADIPKDDQYRLFVQILVAANYNDAIRRQQLLRCQIFTISSLGTFRVFI
jgi:hypothetical protein